MKKIKLLTVFGTRPEAIKLAPFIKTVEYDSACTNITCATTQHRKLQNDILKLFNIQPDYNLDIMEDSQDLFHITEIILHRIKKILETEKPDFTIVQGDTTTAFAAALSSFYCKIPTVHIEAGLRTKNIHDPYPEELNRTLISHIASLHMAPTQQAINNLANEGITQNVHLVGNTTVDALECVLNNIVVRNNTIKKLTRSVSPKILITVHRRENFGLPLKEICSAISNLTKKYPNYTFIWPVHPNPNIKTYVHQYMQTLPNLLILEPLIYSDLIHILNSCTIVLSDSGGIQEECGILGKPIIILRNETERPEIIEHGYGTLTGASRNKILASFHNIITNKKNRQITKIANEVYGKPGVSQKILSKIKNNFRRANNES